MSFLIVDEYLVTFFTFFYNLLHFEKFHSYFSEPNDEGSLFYVGDFHVYLCDNRLFQNQVRRLTIFGTKYHISVLKTQLDWVSAFSAADPRFPIGGGASRGGGQHTKFPQKLHEIERMWTSLVSPLKSVTDILFLPLLEKVGEK